MTPDPVEIVAHAINAEAGWDVSRTLAFNALTALRAEGLEIVRFAVGVDEAPGHGVTVERWPGDDSHLLPSIIGRERGLIDRLAALLLGAARRRHDYTALRETRRGSCFELRLADPAGEPTGHVVLVTVPLQRLDKAVRS